MGSKHICTLEGEYLHEGKRCVCKFNITAKVTGNYKTLRMDANPKGHKRFSKTRPTLDLLKEEFRKWQEENRPPGDSLERKLTRLTEDQIIDAEKAVRYLPDGLTLIEAVEIASKQHLAMSITLSEACNKYVKIQFRDKFNKDGQWSSSKTLAEFKTVMKYPLILLGSRVIKTIQPNELPQFWNWGNKALAAHKSQKIEKVSNQTRKNRYKVLQKFFKWCFVRGYHHQNIMGEHLQISPKLKKSDKPAPKIFTNIQTDKLFAFARSNEKYVEWIPYLAFLHFAGVRPGEAHCGVIDLRKEDRKSVSPLTWNAFRLNPKIEEPYVQLPYSGKMASNRIVKLPKNLANILKLSQERGIPFYCPKITSNTMKRFRLKVGLKDSNSARHTAISNWYRQNPFTGKSATQQELTDQFGNREDTRAEFYINTETIGIAEAQRYWKIGLNWKTISTF